MRLSCCGDDCDACPRYLATQTNNNSALEGLAHLWYELGWRDEIVSADAMRCEGCATVSVCSLGVRDCTRSKRLETCGQCPEYPCDIMKLMFERSEENARICKERCEPQIFHGLNESFFKKRVYLDAVKGR